MVTTKSKFISKRVLIPAILAVGIIVSSIFITPPLENSWAQQQKMATDYTKIRDYDTIPKINGSLSIEDNITNFLKDGAKMPYITAVQSAQNQITNGSVLVGHLGIIQGYLAYTYDIVDSSTDTLYKVIVDVGNGQVLYESEGREIGASKQPMFGTFEHEKGNGFGDGSWNGFGGFLHELFRP
jgi:hypothetical protein